jgi:hypothetical protein
MHTYARAIAAFVTSGVLYLLLPLGITADTTVSTAIEVIILSGLTALSVYFVSNRTK